MTVRILLIILTIAALLLLCLAGCGSRGRMAYQSGLRHLQAQEYQQAEAEFDKALEAEPESRMALYGKARAQYELGKYTEALAAFETFLTATESEKSTYADERQDAGFYRDKCKQDLGQEVPQNPAHIPPPPMGE